MFKQIRCLFILICCCTQAYAQVGTLDSSRLKLIKIVHADSAIIMKDEDKNYNKLIGAVSVEHEGVIMTCDSAYFFLENNFIEAFSHVQVSKANGSSAVADYMKYTGNNSTAFLKGSVQIIDGGNTLITDELTYNIRTKIGKYYHGGTIQTEETNISSEEGNYNGYSQQTYFKKDVVVNSEKYNIQSKELTYNIKTKVVRLLDQSTVVTENSTIQTKKGQYDSKSGNAVFESRTTIENEDQIIIGNKITYNDKNGYAKAVGDVVVFDTKNESQLNADMAEYNKLSGYGKATGHVVIVQDGGKTILRAKETTYNKKTGYARADGQVSVIDTLEKSKLLSGTLEFNENSGFMMATKNPKFITLADKDSLFMRADTLISLRASHLNQLDKKEKISSDKKTKTWMYNLLEADSTYKSEDKEEKKILIANHHVRIFSDSMQAVCDSLHYSQVDSNFKLYKAPVMWSKNQQSSADTIFLQTSNNKLAEVNLIQSAMLISETGQAAMYDQVAGNYVNAFFIENEIDKVKVDQNAESLYYAKDDDGAYIGMNKAESAKMDVFFKDKELDHIVMLENPKGVFYPIDQLTEQNKFLTSFKLYTERKPTSKEDILVDEK